MVQPQPPKRNDLKYMIGKLIVEESKFWYFASINDRNRDSITIDSKAHGFQIKQENIAFQNAGKIIDILEKEYGVSTKELLEIYGDKKKRRECVKAFYIREYGLEFYRRREDDLRAKCKEIAKYHGLEDLFEE